VSGFKKNLSLVITFIKLSGFKKQLKFGNQLKQSVRVSKNNLSLVISWSKVSGFQKIYSLPAFSHWAHRSLHSFWYVCRSFPHNGLNSSEHAQPTLQCTEPNWAWTAAIRTARIKDFPICYSHVISCCQHIYLPEHVCNASCRLSTWFFSFYDRLK
jgi:hypothetical protein